MRYLFDNALISTLYSIQICLLLVDKWQDNWFLLMSSLQLTYRTSRRFERERSHEISRRMQRKRVRLTQHFASLSCMEPDSTWKWFQLRVSSTFAQRSLCSRLLFPQLLATGQAVCGGATSPVTKPIRNQHYLLPHTYMRNTQTHTFVWLVVIAVVDVIVGGWQRYYLCMRFSLAVASHIFLPSLVCFLFLVPSCVMNTKWPLVSCVH